MFSMILEPLERAALISALKDPKVGLRIFKYVKKGDCHVEIDAIHEALVAKIDIDFFIYGKNPILKMLLPNVTNAVTKKNLDVEELIIQGYDPKQIHEICYRFLEDIDVRTHIDKSTQPEKIELIALLLSHGFDISKLEKEIPLILEKFNDNYYFERLLNQKDYFSTIEFDFIKYACLGFNYEQIMEICAGHEIKLDIEKYAKIDYSSSKMAVIREGLESDIDITPYAEKDFNHNQLREILEGLEAKINVSRYAHPNVPYERMRFIKKRLIKLNSSKKEH